MRKGRAEDNLKLNGVRTSKPHFQTNEKVKKINHSFTSIVLYPTSFSASHTKYYYTFLDHQN